jgi:hypothetical protein
VHWPRKPHENTQWAAGRQLLAIGKTVFRCFSLFSLWSHKKVAVARAARTRTPQLFFAKVLGNLGNLWETLGKLVNSAVLNL